MDPTTNSKYLLMDSTTSVDSSHDISASAKSMAANRPASATSTVKMDVSDEMEPANFPLPESPAPEIATLAELDPANYPLPESPMPGGIDFLGTADANPNSSCSLLRSELSKRTKPGEDGFGNPVAASLILEVTESADVVSTESQDSKSTGPPSPKHAPTTGSVSNVLASTNSSDCESPLLGTSAGPESTPGELVQTNSKSPEAKLSGTAASAEVQYSESIYCAFRDLLLSILRFFGLVAPNSTIASSLQSKLSTVPNPSSAVAASPRAHFTRDAEGWVHRFEGGIETFATKSLDSVAEVPDGLTLGQALDAYKAILVDFKKSSSCAEITEFLENTLLKLPTLQLSSCIATGLGTFTAPHPYCRETPDSSLQQLAALEFILEVLRRKFVINTVYIQDPAMNILDEQIVTSLGFTLLHDPEAMNAMTSTTFLYAPYNEFTVIGDLFLVACPAIYLGNDLMFFHNQLLYIPDYLHDKYASQSTSQATSDNDGLEDETSSNKLKEKGLPKVELTDIRKISHFHKYDHILMDYEDGHKSWFWKIWGMQKIYWRED